jgi:hypothetical protein
MALRIRPAGREIRRNTDGPALPVHRLPPERPTDQTAPVCRLSSLLAAFRTLQRITRSPEETSPGLCQATGETQLLLAAPEQRLPRLRNRPGADIT